jgi:Icc-related predicted phosphoesterase
MEVHNSTIRILKYLSKYAPVYTIKGNVGISNLSETNRINKKYGLRLPCTRKMIGKMHNVGLLENRLRNFNGIRIGGLGYFIDISWVREFKPIKYAEKLKSAKRESAKAKRVLRNFDKLNILICHQPPYGILDKVTAKFAPKNWRGRHAGSRVILNCIKSKQPQYVFCGHIHEGKGMAKMGKTMIYNLGVCGHKFIEMREV